MNRHKNGHKILIKIIATIVVCLFAFNSISFADFNENTLSPKLFFSDAKNISEFQASIICDLIEKRLTDTKPLEDVYLDDILLWKNSSDPEFEKCEFEFLSNEIRIKLPGNDIVIRYFDPIERENNHTI